MARKSSPNPTELELEILKVLWGSGAQSPRFVRDALAAGGRDLAYTTVTTTMTTMLGKRLLEREEAGNGFVYRARAEEQATTTGMLRDLLKRAFRGSPASAMLNLLKSEEISDAELKALRAEIEKREGGGG